MKLAIVGYFGWYGSMAEWVANAWEVNGHEVYKIDRKNIDVPLDAKFVLFVDCSEDYSKEIPITITQPKVFWSFDAQMPGGVERSVNISKRSDLVFSMNFEYGVTKLDKFGIDNIWMPATYDSTLVSSNPLQKGRPVKESFDVCMIGHPNSQERIELWKMLNANYVCKTGKVESKDEYTNSMINCQIVVNQPTEPWDVITGIRFFEATGFNKLCLQKVIKTKELEKLGFENGRDFIYWNNFEDLKEKIDYYLVHHDERVEIAFNGFKKVQKMSMAAQAAKMEQIILNKFYDRL